MAQRPGDDEGGNGKEAAQAYWNARRYVAEKFESEPVTIARRAKESFQATVDKMRQPKRGRGEADFSSNELNRCIEEFVGDVRNESEDRLFALEQLLSALNDFLINRHGLSKVVDKRAMRVPTYKQVGRYHWLLGHFLSFLNQEQDIRTRVLKDRFYVQL